MRTTLTLDDDLAAALKAAARRSGDPFKTVVSDAIRRGRSAGDGPMGTRERFRVASAELGFLPGVDPLKLTQLIDEFDVYWFTEQPDGATPDAPS